MSAASRGAENVAVWAFCYVSRDRSIFQVAQLVEDSFVPRHYSCSLKTVSQVIAENRVPRIDLLKIDVEKSEMDVLDGIDARDWPMIRQVTVEVHSIGERVAQVEQLLRRQGFRVGGVQGRHFECTGLYDVHAVRDTG